VAEPAAQLPPGPVATRAPSLLPATTPAWGLGRKLAVAGAAASVMIALVLAFGHRSTATTLAMASIPLPPPASAPSKQVTLASTAVPLVVPVPEPPVAPAPAPRAAAPVADDPPLEAPPAAQGGKDGEDDEPSPRKKAHTGGGRRTAAKVARPAHHARVKAKSKLLASRNTPSAPASKGDPRETYARGNTLLFAGNGEAAVAAYREAVRLAPSDPIGYRGLGLAYEQQGDKPAALRALRKYLKLAPNAPDRQIIARRVELLSRADAVD
jgi:tetratricopeptide (TPR) repeat protein